MNQNDINKLAEFAKSEDLEGIFDGLVSREDQNKYIKEAREEIEAYGYELSLRAKWRS